MAKKAVPTAPHANGLGDRIRYVLLDKWKDEGALVGRVLLITLFLITGWGKLTDFHAAAAYMAGAGAPFPPIAAAIAIAVELFVGILILIGFYVRPLALVVMVFTLCTALIGHRFWQMTGVEQVDNQLHFFKNVSIAGGMLLLSLIGPGRYSIDGK
jgi:putative oxidoreductase